MIPTIDIFDIIIETSYSCVRVWSVQFNLFHDQLVLSASSDSQVLLTRVASIASEPLQQLVEDGEGGTTGR